MYFNSLVDDRNAQNLLNKITNSGKALDCNKQLLFKFYNERLASGIKKGSLVNSLKILSRIVECIDKPFKDVSKEELITFFNDLKPLKVELVTPNHIFVRDVGEYSPQTIMRYKHNVKTFWNWLFENDQTALRDNKGIPLAVSWVRSGNKKLASKMRKDILSREEVMELIKVSPHIRNKAIIAILFETGMRASELLGMKLDEIEFFEDYCEFVCDGKSGKRPVVLVKSYPYFMQWIDWLKRNKHKINKQYQNNVWITIGKLKGQIGEPLNKGSLLFMIKYAAKKTGIQKRIWTHGFRHSSATDFAKQGYNETELRLKYGWTETSNIPSNYTHYKHDELKNKILNRSGKTGITPIPDGNTLQLKECPFCSYENPFDSEYCGKCAKPLDAKKIKETANQTMALQTMQTLISELKNLENKGLNIQQFNQFMQEWTKEKQKQ